jgi:hypothetical protein
MYLSHSHRRVELNISAALIPQFAGLILFTGASTINKPYFTKYCNGKSYLVLTINSNVTQSLVVVPRRLALVNA